VLNFELNFAAADRSAGIAYLPGMAVEFVAVGIKRALAIRRRLIAALKIAAVIEPKHSKKPAKDR
jgi:hypothetical protein